MLDNTTELIKSIPAERMATVYHDSLETIERAWGEIESACDDLKKAFCKEERYTFELGLTSHARNIGIKEVKRAFKREAWSVLIDRLGIRKLMSSKRAAELDDELHQTSRSYTREAEDSLPEISAETLFEVLNGMVSSADEFMQESVQEVYDALKPRGNTKYKTNSSPWKLEPKVIKEWMVEYSCNSFRPCYGASERHLIALDNIFHRLDGKGVPSGHRGPLVDAINACTEGNNTAETPYFKARCFLNRNLHLWFKRQDLLDKFNEIAGRNRLPGTCED